MGTRAGDTTSPATSPAARVIPPRVGGVAGQVGPCREGLTQPVPAKGGRPGSNLGDPAYPPRRVRGVWMDSMAPPVDRDVLRSPRPAQTTVSDHPDVGSVPITARPHRSRSPDLRRIMAPRPGEEQSVLCCCRGLARVDSLCCTCGGCCRPVQNARRADPSCRGSRTSAPGTGRRRSAGPRCGTWRAWEEPRGPCGLTA